MATVYLAEDLRHHRTVAVKVLRPEVAAFLGPERFLREVRIVARLTHPHILPLFDSAEAFGFLYFVMPYIEGSSLRERLLRESVVPFADALRMLRDVADALAYAHRQGIVHRDIKPENILLSGTHAVVADFGVAKALSLATGPGLQTGARMVLGTPAYMPPEQALADPELDHRADIYSWGIVAFETLMGRRPSEAGHSGLPPDVEPLVLRAIEADPAHRWQQADDLVAELDRLLSPSAGGVRTPSAPARRSRRFLRIGVTVLAGVGLLVAAMLWWARAGGRLDPSLVVVVPFENLTGDPNNDVMAAAVTDRLPDLIARSGVVPVVAAAVVRDVVREGHSRDGVLAATVARRTGAGLVVAGAIRARGDSLEFHAEVVRPPTGVSIGQIRPVVATGGASEASERLADRLATLLAANRDWGDEVKWGREYSIPDELSPYQALVRGATSQSRGETGAALMAYDAALSQAPGWPLALIGRAVTIWLSGGGEVADSALARVLERPDLLPGDRAEANRRLAYLRGEWGQLYAYSREAYALAPKSMAGGACWAAMTTARYEEAASFVRHLTDTGFWSAPTRRGPSLYLCVGRALHALGRHREEVQYALALRREFPDMPLVYVTAEIEARAALGQRSEIDRLVRESEGLEPAQAGWLLSRAVVAATELRAHGDSAGADRMGAAAVAWQRRRLELGDTTFARVEALLVALESGSQWNQARELLPLYGRLGRTALDSASAQWHEAMIAARTGQRDTARAVVERYAGLRLPMERPPSGTREYNTARVYAALGDTVLTLVNLRQAWMRGDEVLRTHLAWHRELDTYILQLPAFRQLIGQAR